MLPKQFNILIGAIILSAIILSAGIALQGGVWEYKNFQRTDDGAMIFVKFNRFTGESRLMASRLKDTRYKFIDVADKWEKTDKEDADKIILPK